MRNVLLLPLLLAACSSPQTPERSSESNVAAEASGTPAPAPSAAETAPFPTGATPSPSGLPSALPSAEPTGAASLDDGPEQSAEGAAQVVRRYYRLIGRGQASAAWALWDDRGHASGMSQADFVQSFAKYARLEAAVGRPGRIDAGAGQRYVEVPVTLTGTLTSGEPVTMAGTVVLHRAGPIDGATPEQRRWRIFKADLQPRPGKATDRDAASAAPSTTARYRCTDGSLMLVRLDRETGTADVELGGELLGKLDEQRPASGIWYKRGQTELRGKGEEATIARAGSPELRCTLQG